MLKTEKWTSRGHAAAGHGDGHAPVPLASVASVSVRLMWERRFVCDPVVCSLVLCDHVRQVCEEKKHLVRKNLLNFGVGSESLPYLFKYSYVIM